MCNFFSNVPLGTPAKRGCPLGGNVREKEPATMYGRLLTELETTRLETEVRGLERDRYIKNRECR